MTDDEGSMIKEFLAGDGGRDLRLSTLDAVMSCGRPLLLDLPQALSTITWLCRHHEAAEAAALAVDYVTSREPKKG